MVSKNIVPIWRIYVNSKKATTKYQHITHVFYFFINFFPFVSVTRVHARRHRYPIHHSFLNVNCRKNIVTVHAPENKTAVVGITFSPSFWLHENRGESLQTHFRPLVFLIKITWGEWIFGYISLKSYGNVFKLKNTFIFVIEYLFTAIYAITIYALIFWR